MSEIQRHRINPVAWEDGKGWVRQSIHSKPKVHAIEQPHKKGGWCKWEDVKDLERRLEEARYSATDYAMKLGRANEKLEEAREIVAGMDIYIEAECHESWADNYEIRESAFVDMAKKLKQLKEQNQ